MKATKPIKMRGHVGARTAAAMLGIRYDSFMNLRYRGIAPPCVKNNGLCCYRKRDIEKYKNAHDTTGLICGKEAAFRIGIPYVTLVSWRRREKEGPRYKKIHGRYWYNPEDIEEYKTKKRENHHEQKNPAPPGHDMH